MKLFLEETEIKCEGLQHFIERVKRITRLTELTPELVHEFIEKIVVSAPEKIDGKRHQTVDIYYHGAGIIKMLSAEEMEEAYQQHISKQHKINIHPPSGWFFICGHSPMFFAYA